ncbi:MAG TPA: hypothetical protein VMW23_05450 [Sedimentisphaerales bacterium]|nr:hypothetical protein [Sedimentisphaerales bacterium]
MKDKDFNFSDVLGYGWRTMKANFWFFAGVGFLWAIITYTPAIANALFQRLPFGAPAHAGFNIITTIAGQIINIILSIGLIKIALAFCDGQRPAVGTLFAACGCFWRYLATMILYCLIVFAGLVLLIVPGLIWAIKFSLGFYFVVDKGLDPVAALKASSRTTMGVKWQLFGFGIVCAFINMLGLICLLVGMFATYPTVLVAFALVYRQLLAQTPELAEFGIAGPGPQIESVSLPGQPE